MTVKGALRSNRAGKRVAYVVKRYNEAISDLFDFLPLVFPKRAPQHAMMRRQNCGILRFIGNPLRRRPLNIRQQQRDKAGGQG